MLGAFVKQGQSMFVVDRTVALVRPKQPMLDWLLAQPDNDVDITLEMLRTDCTVLLVPEGEEPEDAISYIDEIFGQVFEMELTSWYDETERWPTNRTLKLFWEWFDVEVHSLVIDTMDEPLLNRPAGDHGLLN